MVSDFAAAANEFGNCALGHIYAAMAQQALDGRSDESLTGPQMLAQAQKYGEAQALVANQLPPLTKSQRRRRRRDANGAERPEPLNRGCAPESELADNIKDRPCEALPHRGCEPESELTDNNKDRPCKALPHRGCEPESELTDNNKDRPCEALPHRGCEPESELADNERGSSAILSAVVCDRQPLITQSEQLSVAQRGQIRVQLVTQFGRKQQPKPLIIQCGQHQQPLIIQCGQHQQPLIIQCGQHEQPLIIQSEQP